MSDNRAILLAVDDRPDNLFVLEQLITAYCPECRVITAQDAQKGLNLAEETPPDVAVIDVQMPGMNGIEMCRRLKTDKATEKVSVILLTAHQVTPQLKVEGLEAGAEDFISKPIDNSELIAKIRVRLRVKQSEERLRDEKTRLEGAVRTRTEQLHAAEDRYKALFNSASDAIFIHDPEGRFLEVNDEACQRLGYTREELLKITPQHIDHVQDARMYSERVEQLRREGQIFFESIHVSKSGEQIPSELNSRIIEYDGRPAIMTIARDIRERKKAEDEKRRLRTQLRQVQKMEALGTLSGGIAHDFNNILFPIFGYTEMSIADASEGSRIHKNLEHVMKAAKRAKELVQQILTFSHETGQELKPLKLQPVIKESLKLLRASLPATIKITQDIDAKCGAIMGDPTQVHQIIMNLCTNAYHAMIENGGILNVELKDMELGLKDMLPHSPDLVPGAYVELTVQDTGHGISQPLMERIFDPYFTTKDKDKGTGLGLSVVHEIVTTYKGYITIDSKPGQGTAFHVYLPLAKSKAASQEILPEMAVLRGQERILLVDDETDIAHMEKMIIERLGYKVTARTSSIEALNVFQANPRSFDLVITDMTMPNMTGMVLSKELQRIRPDIPIIICSGFSELLSKEKLRDMGIQEYVMKPVLKSKIASAIRKALD
ncbi:MAG: hypothetical protein B6245_06130 [Desulfobacteraceae bacterium 4572_88]|nr:MAG: hypothetical protein B6245_06130 [Desulfobacteraceae bacterium 4572_88]